MIRCIIIDDEKHARDSLDLLIKEFFTEKLTVVDKAESVSAGVMSINKNNPDLVFLDIELQDDNGFSLFNHFKHVTFSVIFVTAYKDYALRAIKADATDYLLKPVSSEDLSDAIGLYERKIIGPASKWKMNKALNAGSPDSFNLDKVALPTFNGYHVEKISSIIYCEADQNYTRIFTKESGELLISKPLNSVEASLPANQFFRIHKSYLVNLNYVKDYSRVEGHHVILENGKSLSIAFRRKDDFIKTLTRKH